MAGDCQQELEENASSDKETMLEDEQELHEASQNPLAQSEPTIDSSRLDEEVEAPHDSNLRSDHRHWKQDERMVLEAGSKAAEIAKSVFGKWKAYPDLSTRGNIGIVLKNWQLTFSG